MKLRSITKGRAMSNDVHQTASAIAAFDATQLAFAALVKKGILPKAEAEQILRQAMEVIKTGGSKSQQRCEDRIKLAVGCVYRKLDSASTAGKDGISSRPDDRSVQADSRSPGFALQVESKAGSRNPGSTATDQCASPTGVEATAPQQCRPLSVCLALSLVSLRPWRD